MSSFEQPQQRIRHLRLRNIRCFKHLEIDFCDEDSGEPVPWTVILGDNGSGKSTLLKALALALSSPKDARGLFESDSREEWLRRDTNEGAIELVISAGHDSPEIRREIRIEHASYGEEMLHIHENDSPPAVDATPFVCGYGAARRTFGTTSPRGYTSREAVATLFDIEASLQNPELSLRRSLDSREDLLQSIDRILTLPKGSTRLGHEGIEVRGPWGVYLPLMALSDGYRATLAWILDMIGWAILKDEGMLKDNLRGIILVDEIEQHLHPSWQRRIIGLLRKQFPGLNMVVTTHAPLCVSGTTDLEDHEVNIVHLRWEDDAVTASTGYKPPRGQRADQILTSYLFGLSTTGDDRTRSQIERLSELLSLGDSATPDEQEERERLRSELDETLGSRETELETKTAEHIETALRDRLEELVRDRIKSAGSLPNGEAALYEVRRQLKSLLK